MSSELHMWSNLQAALIITRREIRDQYRDWRIILPLLVLTLFFPGLMNFAARQVVTFVVRHDVPLIGDRLIPFLLMIVSFFPISVSLVIALESFVGEKERRSIEPLLSSPLTDLQLYLGKLLAVLLPPILASLLGISVYLLGVYRQIGWIPDPTLLVQVIALAVVQALLMVSGAVVISTQTTSARAANLLASFIIVPMALLLVGESMIMFWARYNVLWWAIFGQVLIAGLLVRMGITHFNREELLNRELDTLNFKNSWRAFRIAFLGDAPSFLSWLRYDVSHTLRQLKFPTLLIIIFFGAGFWIGANQADVFVLPPEVFDFSNLEERFLGGVDVFQFFSVGGVRWIWMRNLQVVLLTTLLGIFSFGVLGLIVLMMPFAIIGFFTATAARVGIAPDVFIIAFVLPHGILEIPAIVLSGAAILRLGATLAAPAEGCSLSDALIRAFADWGKIMLFYVVPLFLGAAILEVFLTPKIALQLLGN